MLILLAVPVILSVAIAHRHLRLNAPSNLVIARVRRADPRFRDALALLLLGLGMALVAHVVDGGIRSGAPGWLYLVVFVLAWDAIKFICAGVLTALRGVGHAVQAVAGRDGVARTTAR